MYKIINTDWLISESLQQLTMSCTIRNVSLPWNKQKKIIVGFGNLWGDPGDPYFPSQKASVIYYNDCATQM